jgi:hypothetical protein
MKELNHFDAKLQLLHPSCRTSRFQNPSRHAIRPHLGSLTRIDAVRSKLGKGQGTGSYN